MSTREGSTIFIPPPHCFFFIPSVVCFAFAVSKVFLVRRPVFGFFISLSHLCVKRPPNFTPFGASAWILFCPTKIPIFFFPIRQNLISLVVLPPWIFFLLAYQPLFGSRIFSSGKNTFLLPCFNNGTREVYSSATTDWATETLCVLLPQPRVRPTNYMFWLVFVCTPPPCVSWLLLPFQFLFYGEGVTFFLDC